MKILRRLTAVLLALTTAALHSACESLAVSGYQMHEALAAKLPHAEAEQEMLPLPATRSLTASNGDWKLNIAWNPQSLNRAVTWSQGGLNGKLVIPLVQRAVPWTDAHSHPGIQMTRHGPYHPAYTHTSPGGRRWAVTMSQEQVDFPSVEQLARYLQITFRTLPQQKALSADGVLVTLDVRSAAGVNSLGIQISYLTVKGKRPAADRLKAFAAGRFTMK